MPGIKYSPQEEQRLQTEIWDPKISENPYLFVKLVFPWGQPGPLEKQKIRKWQEFELKKIAEHIQTNKALMARGELPKVYKLAIASGRGIGKSSLVAWLILWQMSCHLGSTTIVTANSEAQLKDRTWAELGVWLTHAINGHWFESTSAKLMPAKWFLDSIRELKFPPTYYYANAQLWSEENPVAFAGAHNPAGMMIIFDEASGIPKPIWTVADGFLTEPMPWRFYFCFSNPRLNTGPFYECFYGEVRSYWETRSVDSRTVEGLDYNHLNEMIAKHGEDSDEARVEVKGEFPHHGENQFISGAVVDEAVKREVTDDQWAPLIMGVDIARFGNDATVIRFRQGRNARVIPPIEMRRADNMAVVNMIAGLIQKYQPDAVCIDSGAGTGVIDRLKELKYNKIVHEIIFGGKAFDEQWADRRTEIWAELRDALPGMAIDGHKLLLGDLKNPRYKFVQNGNKIKLESKEEMKKRQLDSPDHGDALALTFGVKVARKDLAMSPFRRSNRMANGVDYDMFGG